MPVMEHDARFIHLEIFERLNMPPRLLAHLTLVHDAETKVKIDNSAFFVDKFRPMPYNLKLCGRPHWGASLIKTRTFNLKLIYSNIWEII